MVSLEDPDEAEEGASEAQTSTVRVRTKHDGEGDHSISTSVVKAASAVTGDAPTTIDPLYEVVNPEPLDELLASVRGDERATVSFSFHECGVIVNGTGEIDVRPADIDSI